eukprot:328019-Chlamydomonas_euryale.AAC.1
MSAGAIYAPSTRGRAELASCVGLQGSPQVRTYGYGSRPTVYRTYRIYRMYRIYRIYRMYRLYRIWHIYCINRM